jgi:hypothetical protein
MIFFRLKNGKDPFEVARRLDEQGVRMLAMRPGMIRAVTHLDINDEQINRAIVILRDTIAGAA